MFIEIENESEPNGIDASNMFRSFNIISKKTDDDNYNRDQYIFSQLPIAILILRGPDYIIESTNDVNLKIWGKERDIVGKPLLDVMPEFSAPGHMQILNSVYTTGQPFYSTALPIAIIRNGKLETDFYNVEYQPLKDNDGTITGLFVTGFDVTNHVITKQQLQESEQQFRNLVMQSPIAMGVLKGNDWIVEVANEALLKIWHRKDKQIIGKKLIAVLPELADQPFATMLNKVYKSRLAYKEEEAIVHVNSGGELKEMYVTFQYSPIIEQNNSVTGVFVTANNVTEQVKARKRIEENEQYFRKMADNVPTIIFLWKSNGYCTYKNKRWFEYTGATEEEAQGFNWLNYVDINNRPEVQQTLFDAIKNKSSLKTEFRLKNKSGAYRWFEKLVTLRINDEGEIEGYIGTLTDIHERKLTEDQLKDAEERMRLAAEATGLASFDTDLQTKTIIASPRLYEIFGFDKAESEPIQRRIFLKRFHVDDWHIISNVLQQVVQTGYYSYEMRVVWPDNSIHWIKTKGKIFYSPSRKPLRMLGMVEDITKRKQLEEHKDQFMGIVSHELKTPVTSLKVYSKLMQQKFTESNDTDSAELLQRMDSQVNKLTKLIKDLLDTARIDTGKLQVEKQIFDLNELTDEVIKEMEVTTATHTLVKQNNDSFIIMGDRERSGQVITSFIANAVKYSPNGSTIIINMQQKDNNVLYSVQDFGVGIGRDNLENIFKKYFRINDDVLGTYPGLGLGLFLSSQIIRQQGGEIWAESHAGKGSTFWFSLPLHEEGYVVNPEL